MHWLLVYFYFFDISFVLALLLTPLFRQLSHRWGMVDQPDLARKIHTGAMPLLGGVAVFTAFAVNVLAHYFLGLFLAGRGDWLSGGLSELLVHAEGALAVGPKLFVLFAGGALMIAIGLYDDKHDLSAGYKLAAQLLIAALVAAFGMRLTIFIDSTLISVILTVLWIVTMTNAMNFLDNMDGLCAGVGFVCASMFAFVAAAQEQYFVCLLAVALAGALLGFLPYNFKPATIFLGDAGSHFIGYMLAILPLLASFYTPGKPTLLPVLIPLLVLAVPLFDLVMVMAIRLSRGQPMHIGDVNHLSHRLVRVGLPQSWAVALIYLITLTLGLGATILLWAELTAAIVVVAQGVCILAIITLLEQLGKK